MMALFKSLVLSRLDYGSQLWSRCYGGLFHRHMIILKLFYLLYTSFMLNDQSTDNVVLKAKPQQQIIHDVT